jgi:DNA replication protein DnaC
MRMRGMAEALREQQESADAQRLSFEERLGMLIDRQWNWRENRALDRRLRNGRLNGPACVEDIDYRTPRGLDRQMARSLTRNRCGFASIRICFSLVQPVSGKTWLARAFAHKACRDGYTALFLKASELFRNLATARVDGSHSKLLYQLSKVDLLIVDDWAMGRWPMASAGIFSM